MQLNWWLATIKTIILGFVTVFLVFSYQQKANRKNKTFFNASSLNESVESRRLAAGKLKLTNLIKNERTAVSSKSIEHKIENKLVHPIDSKLAEHGRNAKSEKISSSIHQLPLDQSKAGSRVSILRKSLQI